MDNFFSLPGISRIGYLPKAEVPAHVIMQSQASLPVGIFTKPTPIAFIGQPTCECKRSNANNGSSEQVTLVFRSLQVIPEDEELAFLITDMNGQAFLIGNREEPMPKIEALQNFGVASGEPHAIKYTIDFTAPIALIPCFYPS